MPGEPPPVRQLWALALLAGLAGCFGPHETALLTIPTEKAPTLRLLPDAGMLPPGFSEETRSAADMGLPGILDGHVRVFERREGVSLQRLATGALLFESEPRAAEAFDLLTRSSSMSPVGLGDEALREESRADELGWQGEGTFARSGAYVVWVSHDAQHGLAGVDATEVARAMIARIR